AADRHEAAVLEADGACDGQRRQGLVADHLRRRRLRDGRLVARLAGAAGDARELSAALAGVGTADRRAVLVQHRAGSLGAERVPRLHVGLAGAEVLTRALARGGGGNRLRELEEILVARALGERVARLDRLPLAGRARVLLDRILARVAHRRFDVEALRADRGVAGRGEVGDVDLVHGDAGADADGARLGRLAGALRRRVRVRLGRQRERTRRAGDRGRAERDADPVQAVEAVD